MDNLDDSENNAKVSDSAYSNSCSNSQSRRSHSSKSTHSGSNSSGSSGYVGKPSTSGSSNNLSQPSKKDKDIKKKKQIQTETITTDSQKEIDSRPPDPAPVCVEPAEENKDVDVPAPAQSETDVENMDTSAPADTDKKEVVSGNASKANSMKHFVTSRPTSSYSTDGFSCVISMHDGIVMFTTLSLTTTLGFPKDMWIGRSFIDFVHPKDRNTFASQVTSGLAVPKIVNGTLEKGQKQGNPLTTMGCRIRRYRGFATSFGVKNRVVTFMPFLLKFAFKNISDEEGKIVYLVIQATPFFSAFRIPNEIVAKAVPFVIRHSANGNIEYIDPESVPYLGYLQQDVTDKDALQMYHPDDLDYLQQVYETIVKEGSVPRSNAYRMMAQNGDYLKVETEWSSFINPWSKRLEFVIGKHHIIEGPANPDVFQSPDPDKPAALSEEDKAKAEKFREGIVRIMNEVLTKPAEMAKQQMSKRCQDLASFIENLMEEQQLRIDEELHLDIQDPDHSYYERDSVMLGGISPHHDYNDSKSSIGTPLSYNQLNYNETLLRYFDSHKPYPCEEFNANTRENVLGIADPKPVSSSCMSPIVQNSGESAEQTSSCASSAVTLGVVSPLVALGDYQPVRLTESLLTKHNAEMEKELMKMHRETRSSTKSDREMAAIESRQKKKMHLARCNASFQPTFGEYIPPADPIYKKPHGVKRASKQLESEAGAYKHHCPSPRQPPRKLTTSAAPSQSSSTITTTVAASYWPGSPVNNMSTYILGVGIPQQMSYVSPIPAMPGMFQMYYTPATGGAIPAAAEANKPPEPVAPSTPQYHTPAVPCVMYGQPMYGPPIMYSPITPPVSYPMQHNMQYTNQQLNPLCLANSNYEEACRVTFPPISNAGRRYKKLSESKASKNNRGNLASSKSSKSALKRESGAAQSKQNGQKSTVYSSDIRSTSNSLSTKSTEAIPDTTPACSVKPAIPPRNGNSEVTVDKTDGESSYSSFYSSFFKTESGSAEESSDAKKTGVKSNAKMGRKLPLAEDAMSLQSSTETPTTKNDAHQNKVPQRKMEPPWMEQVCVTSELIYKYQISAKPMDDTLKADQQKISELAQPSLVNEQLGQLYLDLQLEGVAARLTLEEGITSSSSSGEEASTSSKQLRRKCEYSKLVMIYEENAPMPPPPDGAEPVADKSTT